MKTFFSLLILLGMPLIPIQAFSMTFELAGKYLFPEHRNYYNLPPDSFEGRFYLTATKDTPECKYYEWYSKKHLQKNKIIKVTPETNSGHYRIFLDITQSEGGDCDYKINDITVFSPMPRLLIFLEPNGRKNPRQIPFNSVSSMECQAESGKTFLDPFCIFKDLNGNPIDSPDRVGVVEIDNLKDFKNLNFDFIDLGER